MAADIKARFSTDVELIKGRDGVFEVRVGGDLVYSKRETGRFPEPGEAEEAVAGRL